MHGTCAAVQYKLQVSVVASTVCMHKAVLAVLLMPAMHLILVSARLQNQPLILIYSHASQGAQDHISRLQSQLAKMQVSLQQTQALTDNAASRGQADLSHAEAELARARAELTQLRAQTSEHNQEAAKLRQQLDHEKAEVLLLKEGQGGSNRATDVIHALESQVSQSSCCSSPVSLLATGAILCSACRFQVQLQVVVRTSLHSHFVAFLHNSGCSSLCCMPSSAASC